MRPGDTLPSWPRSAPPPLERARLRERPEDFLVEEILPFAPAGEGEHLWLRIRKRGRNTAWVADWLARRVGVPRQAVGYAGLKDRHAVAIQWFSVHLPPGCAPAAWEAVDDPGIEVLEVRRHTRKLRIGALAGNRFTLTLRGCAGDRARFAERLAAVARAGVPNYFGEQRFGHGGENVERARAMFAGALDVRDRHRRGLYLSAARSLLFNEVLARRVTEGSWQRLLDGEVVSLDGSRSFFPAPEVDATLNERLARGDVHPSGPLWGAGELPSRRTARALEEAVAAAQAELARGLERSGLRQERRPLRLIPQALTAEWLDATTLRLSFCLPPGSYATTVLRELADYQDVARAGEDAA